MTDASIIIPAHGRPELLHVVLEAADRQASGAFEIIVVADGCPAAIDTVRRMRFQHPCRLYDTGCTEKFGAALARNIGARFAEGDLLVFLDADCLVGPNHVEAYRKADDGESLLLGPIDYVAEDDHTKVVERELREPLRHTPLTPSDTRQISWLATCTWSGNMAVPRRRFRSLGGFDLAFMGQGGEDVDFGLRYACCFRQIKGAPAPVRHVGLTSGVRTDAASGQGAFDTSRINRLIAERYYRPGMAGLVVNGGEAFFDQPDAWSASIDLLG